MKKDKKNTIKTDINIYAMAALRYALQLILEQVYIGQIHKSLKWCTVPTELCEEREWHFCDIFPPIK